MIALTPVLKSSNIAGVAYDYLHEILAVEFSGGTVWHYKHVPQEIGQGMMWVVQQANSVAETGLAMDDDDKPSVGRFFAARVKGKYDAEKIVTA